MKYSSLNDLSDGMIDTAEFSPHLKELSAELCREIQPN